MGAEDWQNIVLSDSMWKLNTVTNPSIDECKFSNGTFSSRFPCSTFFFYCLRKTLQFSRIFLNLRVSLLLLIMKSPMRLLRKWISVKKKFRTWRNGGQFFYRCLYFFTSMTPGEIQNLLFSRFNLSIELDIK